MHKSRLGVIVLDCRTTELDEAASFWGGALGYDIVSDVEPGDEHYRQLGADARGPKILLQSVSHPSRVHIDIETDNVDAEVERLEALGAKRLERVRTWWVMEAPTGHRFCVVQPQRPDFAAEANIWGHDEPKV